jgi:DNA invertase Pin-like site-specific DNA recombinase
MLWGYARQSKNDSNTSSHSSSIHIQKEKLIAHGVSPSNILMDIDSGDNNGESLDNFIKTMQVGDVLVSTHLDRVSRSLINFCRLLENLEKRNLYLRIISEGIDTQSSSVSQKLLLSVLMIFSEFELQRIRSRTKTALEAKKKQGVCLGRPKGSISQNTRNLQIAMQKLIQDGLPPRSICKQLGISRAYFYHLKKQAFDMKKH